MADEQPVKQTTPDILDFDIEHERKPHNREGNHGYYYCDLLNSEHGGPTYECNCGLPEAITAHEALLVERDDLKAENKRNRRELGNQCKRAEDAEGQVEVLREALGAICNEAMVWTTDEIVAEARKALAGQ